MGRGVFQRWKELEERIKSAGIKACALLAGKPGSWTRERAMP
jgi:hypothetical protein